LPVLVGVSKSCHMIISHAMSWKQRELLLLVDGLSSTELMVCCIYLCYAGGWVEFNRVNGLLHSPMLVRIQFAKFKLTLE
jgi:hypothetical protein